MSLQWFNQAKPKCRCESDVTQVSTVISAMRGNPPRSIRSRKVRHYRERDEAYFWHWEDQGWNLHSTMHPPPTISD